MGALMTVATYPLYQAAVALLPWLEPIVAGLYRTSHKEGLGVALAWVIVILSAEELLFRGAWLDVVDDAEATSAQAAFIPFLHILGTGSAALVVGYASEIPGVGLRGAFALPAVATLLAGVLAYRASQFVSEDMQAKQQRRSSQNFPPQT